MTYSVSNIVLKLSNSLLDNIKNSFNNTIRGKI